MAASGQQSCVVTEQSHVVTEQCCVVTGQSHVVTDLFEAIRKNHHLTVQKILTDKPELVNYKLQTRFRGVTTPLLEACTVLDFQGLSWSHNYQ
jgi:hypothetical protein